VLRICKYILHIILDSSRIISQNEVVEKYFYKCIFVVFVSAADATKSNRQTDWEILSALLQTLIPARMSVSIWHKDHTISWFALVCLCLSGCICSSRLGAVFDN
jgi:hypothetical protein